MHQMRARDIKLRVLDATLFWRIKGVMALTDVIRPEKKPGSYGGVVPGV